MTEIGQKLGISSHKIVYWMKKHRLKRRSRSEATYVKRNPNGDPFCIKRNLTERERQLLGLGL